LLVARIAAHDADHATAAHNLALIANSPDTGADFHGNTRSTNIENNASKTHHQEQTSFRRPLSNQKSAQTGNGFGVVENG
jgi:hypothetical protein